MCKNIWKNLNECESFKRLTCLAVPRIASILKSEDGPARVKRYSASIIDGLHYNYAAKKVDEKILATLQDLSDEQALVKKYECLLQGEPINTGEKRLVLHHLTRHLCSDETGNGDGPCNGNASSSNAQNISLKDIHAFYQREAKKVREFTDRIHSRAILSSSAKPFTDVVQIGIGGSDLGPRSLYLALKEYAHQMKEEKMRGHFISNIDPEDAMSTLSRLDVSSTLFIIVSKSGTTEETLANEKLLLKFLETQDIKEPKKNILVVTSESSPLSYDASYLQSFFIDDYIGGRYSSSSCCGLLLLSLCFGNALLSSFLQGAHLADVGAKNPKIRENAALMDALIGVYESSVLHYPATAVLPYSQALSRFPAHLQQLDMESSGKQVNRNFQYIDYPTGQLLFGEPGTNGQHSFYQFLHQSRQVVPLQFIAFKESTISCLSQDGKPQLCACIRENHKKLLTNLIAQIYAFAVGKEDGENANKCFEGERPSSLIYGDKLDGKMLGALLAHFENKVMFQGFLWNINSFDQEGVQLGKMLAKKIAKGEMDPSCEAYYKLLL